MTRKAHHAFSFESDRREYDDTQARVAVNNGAGAISLGMAYVSGIGNGTHAILTPQMARDLAQDLIERADELDPPKELTLRTLRKATPEEVEDLVTGTGAMTWSWWSDWGEKSVDGVDGWEFKHDNGESAEGAGDITTWVSNQQILDAAGQFIAEGRLVHDVADVMTESIGFLDAADADVVLQYAVLGKAIFA